MINLTEKKEIQVEDKQGTSQIVVHNGTIYNRIELSNGHKYFDRYEGEQTDIFVQARMLNKDKIEYRFYNIHGEMAATKYLIGCAKYKAAKQKTLISNKWSFVCTLTKSEERIINRFIDYTNSRKATVINR